MERIRVLLVDDHAVVRQGLRALLDGEPDIEIVAEAENGRQAIALTLKYRPTVVIMDVAMPLLNGVEATRQILRELKDTKVLVLTSYGDDLCVRQMMSARAAGFLVKQTAANDLLKAIRELSVGNTFFSPSIARRLRDQCRAGATPPKGARSAIGAKLTAREGEVLQLIAEGFANKQIAAELGISIKTVEKHRQQVMDKLDIHDIAGLTRHAVATGIVGRDIRSQDGAHSLHPLVPLGGSAGDDSFPSAPTDEWVQQTS